MMKKIIFAFSIFIFHTTCCMEQDTFFGSLTRLHSHGRSLDQLIIFTAARQCPTQIPTLACVCWQWTGYVQKPELQKLKQAVIRFNVKLCNKIDEQDITEDDIMKSFEDRLFCPYFKFYRLFHSSSYAKALVNFSHLDALKKLLTCNKPTPQKIFDFLIGYTCVYHDEEILDILDELRYDFKSTNALDCAARYYWPRAVALFIVRGCDVNRKDANGVTPLFHTIKDNLQTLSMPTEFFWTTIDLLLTAGADPNVQVNGITLQKLINRCKDKNTKRRILKMLNHFSHLDQPQSMFSRYNPFAWIADWIGQICEDPFDVFLE